MPAFTLYLLKVIACSTILFGYYWLFLRNKVFHHYNRFYLLAVIVLSISLPFIRVTIPQQAGISGTNVIRLLEVVNGPGAYLDDAAVNNMPAQAGNTPVLLILFIATCFFFAVAFLRSIIKIYALKSNNPVQQFEGLTLINTTDKSTPFSFLKNIFWNTGIDIQSDNGQRILQHELAHVELKHSHDKLFINMIMIIYWCNPVFWLLRKELNMIHEFTADKIAVEDGDTSSFAAMILQTTYPAHHFSLTNPFFYSPIKRRLIMLTKNNVTKAGYLSRMLALPVMMVVFAAFTFKSATSTAPAVDKTFTLVIDAGHGGTDDGATAVDGTKEKDINLMLAQKIKELNADPNLHILLTRKDDTYQSPKEKSAIATKLNANLFISLHMQSSSQKAQTDHSGMSVYVAKDQYANALQSKLFASAVIATFTAGFTLPVEKQPLQASQGIWVLQASNCPSILVEAGYMNNKNDLAFMKSEAGQTIFAQNILAALHDYISVTNAAATKE